MREIKFRAWYKKHDKMYNYVEHITYPDGSSGIGCIGYLEGERMFSPDDNEVELMQYTGLKDRYGNKIFEGDIIRAEEEGLGVIKYGIGCFYYEDDWNGRIALEELTDLMVVVGNVYEHPELLPQDDFAHKTNQQ